MAPSAQNFYGIAVTTDIGWNLPRKKGWRLGNKKKAISGLLNNRCRLVSGGIFLFAIVFFLERVNILGDHGVHKPLRR